MSDSGRDTHTGRRPERGTAPDSGTASDPGAAPDSVSGSAHTGESEARDTVEHVVRAQLAKVLGGPRGVVESAVPTAAFTITFVATDVLRTSLIVGITAAVVALLVRLAQRSNPQFVLNSLFGIGIAAIFAARSGQAEDAFLPGILYNAAYSVVLTVSILVRWPLMGFLVGSITGSPTEWRRDPAMLRLCSRLTWLLVLPCVVRVLVQYPLYTAGEGAVGWLGTSKIVLGWPLQVAAFMAMGWLLARGRTPVTTASPAGPDR